MKRFVLTAAALCTVASGSAGAADLPVKAPPAATPAAYSWTGCHIGINGGGKWGRVQGGEFVAAANGPGGPSAVNAFPFDTQTDPSGTAVAGGQVGCDYQIGYGVYGIEGDADWQNWREQLDAGALVPGDRINFSSRWQASLRGRAGYASDNVLIYATGGVAWTDLKLDANFVPFSAGGVAFPGTIASDKQTLVGATAGAGMEFALTRNLIVGIEGRYTVYGGQNFNTGLVATAGLPPAGPFTFAQSTTGVRLNTAELIARLNWKFDWLGPVVAKY